MGLSLFLSFLVPSCAKQASLSFLAQVSEVLQDFRLSGSAYPGTSPTTSSGKQSLMYSDGPLHSLCSFNVARRPAENAKSVIHTQSESNFLAEESQKGSSASSPFNRATAFLHLRPHPSLGYELSLRILESNFSSVIFIWLNSLNRIS